MKSAITSNRLTRRVVWALAGLAILRPAAGQEPLRLSMKEAVERALSQVGNAAVQMAAENVFQARAASEEARSFLLPHLDATIAEQNQTRNLEALGLTPQGLFRPPTLVGPFTTFDARANLSQSVFDLRAIRRFQASKISLKAAEIQGERSKDLVAGQVAGLYLKALQARESVTAAQADVALAEQLVALAVNQRAVGSGTRVEETRASAQLANERQRLLSRQFESRRAVLELLRHIGLDLKTPLELTDSLDPTRWAAPTFEAATQEAFVSRQDLRAQLQAEATARKLSNAASSDWLPTVSAFANYGSIGASPGDSIPTWAAGIWLRVPVFEGGRLAAERHQANSRLRTEQIKTADLRRQIELEVRLALSGLELAWEQISVADQGLELAQEELSRAQRRYRAGVTTSLEVTGAQARLERGRENRIAALFNLNLARINLSEAMGTIRHDLE